jgi:hypothetical protein
LKQERRDEKRVLTFAIDYAPGDETVRPRFVDVSIQPNKPITYTIEDVSVGAGMTRTNKQFLVNDLTSKDYLFTDSGAVKFLIYGLGNLSDLSGGRVFTFTIVAEIKEPISFSISRKENIFAPVEADSALQKGPVYSFPIQVQP